MSSHAAPNILRYVDHCLEILEPEYWFQTSSEELF